jgi:hypothetical protein
MSWTSTRDLPPGWSKIRAQVLQAQPACQLAYPDSWPTQTHLASCAGTSTEVDHIGDPADHRLVNLRGVCTECHARRTSEQARAAVEAQHAKLTNPVHNQPHPAFL